MSSILFKIRLPQLCIGQRVGIAQTEVLQPEQEIGREKVELSVQWQNAYRAFRRLGVLHATFRFKGVKDAHRPPDVLIECQGGPDNLNMLQG